MSKCSFGRIILNDIFDAKYPFGKDLEGRFIYIENESMRWLLGVFDFSGSFRRTCLAWRNAVSCATGIPAENIWYHELQTHAAPISWELDGEPCRRLIDKTVPVIREMISKAEEAELCYIICDFEDKFTLNREQYIPELGTVTVWSGLKFDNAGLPYTQNPEFMLLDGYLPPIPAFKEPIYFDRPVDSQAVLMVFRAKSGKVLGSISRFAAHPDVAVLFESRGIYDQYHYSSDWPGYLRDTIQSAVGGISLYINGPCANLSVKKGYDGMDTYIKCEEEARRIGEEIALEFLRQWSSCRHTWQDISLKGGSHKNIKLPIRNSIALCLNNPLCHEEKIKEAGSRLALAIASGQPPAAIKRLIDEKKHLSAAETIIKEWAGLERDELENGLAEIELEAVAINDLVLAGLPGECLTETCTWLRSQSLGNKLIVLDQVNGYMGYMTTPESYDQGGYTYWGGWVARNAEPAMRKGCLGLIRKLTL